MAGCSAQVREYTRQQIQLQLWHELQQPHEVLLESSLHVCQLWQQLQQQQPSQQLH